MRFNLRPNKANPKSENKKGKKKDPDNKKKNQKASFRRGHGRAPASSTAERLPEAAPADGHGADAASPATWV